MPSGLAEQHDIEVAVAVVVADCGTIAHVALHHRAHRVEGREDRSVLAREIETGRRGDICAAKVGASCRGRLRGDGDGSDEARRQDGRRRQQHAWPQDSSRGEPGDGRDLVVEAELDEGDRHE